MEPCTPHPEIALYRARASNDKTMYGAAPELRHDLLKEQGGVCAICERPNRQRDRSGKPRSLGLDHDHATGKTRGLLCHHCNTAIGQLDHDPDLLRAAIRYLRKYQDR